MSTTCLQQASDSVPIPPRYWWLWRVGLFALAYVAFVVGLRLYAGWKTERMLEEEIAALRARGVPILPEDFHRPPVPDEQNAAILLQQAAAAFVDGPLEEIPPGTHAEIRDRFMSISGPASFVQVIRARADELAPILEANREALDLIRQARGRPEADAGIHYSSPMVDLVNANLPLRSHIRTLGELVWTNAIYQHHTGNHAEAIEAVFDLELIAKTQYRSGSFLLGHFAAISVDYRSPDALESIIPTLRVANDPSPIGNGITPVPRQRVETLICTLVDHRSARASFERSTRLDIALCLDAIRALARGETAPATFFGPRFRTRLPSIILSLLSRPMWYWDARAFVASADAFAGAANSPSFPAALRLSPTLNYANPLLRVIPSVWERFPPALDGAYRLHHTNLTYRGLAAAALAIRLYELDHGRRPHADPPLLYSVGPDLIDQGGIPLETVDGERHGDMLFHLRGEPSQEINPALLVRPSLEKGAEQQRDVEEAERQEDQNPDRRRQP